MRPLITVIVPTYNNLHALKDCLDSILIQDYPFIEIIIADDCSEEFDVSYWNEYINNNKGDNLVSFYVFSNNSNLGTVKNLNLAIKYSHGDILKIIANDDALYDSTVLSSIESSIRGSKSKCFVGNVMLCDAHLNETGLANNRVISTMENKSTNELFGLMCVRNFINASGAVFKREFFDTYGFFSEEFKLIEDWPTWLTLLKNNERFAYLNFIVAKRRVETGVVSNNNRDYLNDRKKVWSFIIKRERRTIGLRKYLLSFLNIKLFSSPFLRKIAYIFVKKR